MSETKRFTRNEVSSYNSQDNAVFIIHNYVYDVKAFLDDHPGGHEVLIDGVGKDISENYEDMAHSREAKELINKYQIGEVVDDEKLPVKKRPANNSITAVEEEDFFTAWKLPIFLGILATLVLNYLL